MKILWVPLLFAAQCMTGCANFNSVYRTLDTSGGKGVLIDIKQRAILASHGIDKDGKEDKTRSIVCAEPSPDALSAYALDLAAKRSDAAGKAVSAGLGSTENAAFVGLRTQSIQLLRDQFFRACEAYMNRAIDSGEYNLLIRRYQKQTAALLAIEQLTSIASVPGAAVSASSAAKGSTQNFLQTVYQGNVEKLAAMSKVISDPKSTDEQKKSGAAEIDRLNKENAQIIQSLASTDASGDPSVKVQAPGAKAGIDPAAKDAATVPSVVQHIVDNITQTDDFLQLCVLKYGSPDTPAGSPPGPSTVNNVSESTVPVDMRSACMVRLGIANEYFSVQVKVTQNIMQEVLKDPKLTPAEKADKLDALTPRDSDVFSGLVIRRRQLPPM